MSAVRQCAVLVAVATLGMALGITVSAAITHAAQTACPGTIEYGIGGNTDPSSSYVPGAHPGMVRIGYPADVFRGDYSRSVAESELDAQARTFRENCPGSHITVRGYSLGASAASLVVDQWQTDPRMNHNTDEVLYGDPRRPGTPGYGGIETVGLPNIPNVYTFRGPHTYGLIPVLDVCHLGHDIVCDSPRPIQSNLPEAWTALLGYMTGGHVYP